MLFQIFKLWFKQFSPILSEWINPLFAFLLVEIPLSRSFCERFCGEEVPGFALYNSWDAFHICCQNKKERRTSNGDFSHRYCNRVTALILQFKWSLVGALRKYMKYIAMERNINCLCISYLYSLVCVIMRGALFFQIL